MLLSIHCHADSLELTFQGLHLCFLDMFHTTCIVCNVSNTAFAESFSTNMRRMSSETTWLMVARVILSLRSSTSSLCLMASHTSCACKLTGVFIDHVAQLLFTSNAYWIVTFPYFSLLSSSYLLRRLCMVILFQYLSSNTKCWIGPTIQIYRKK